MYIFSQNYISSLPPLTCTHLCIVSRITMAFVLFILNRVIAVCLNLQSRIPRVTIETPSQGTSRA